MQRLAHACKSLHRLDFLTGCGVRIGRSPAFSRNCFASAERIAAGADYIVGGSYDLRITRVRARLCMVCRRVGSQEFCQGRPLRCWDAVNCRFIHFHCYAAAECLDGKYNPQRVLHADNDSFQPGQGPTAHSNTIARLYKRVRPHR